MVTLPFSVREGINIFLAGFVPTENLRFREESLSFKVAEQNVLEEDVKKFLRYQYPNMTKTQVSWCYGRGVGGRGRVCDVFVDHRVADRMGIMRQSRRQAAEAGGCVGGLGHEMCSLPGCLQACVG